jgi:hypothetical protein
MQAYTTVLDISNELNSVTDRGLISLVLHPMLPAFVYMVVSVNTMVDTHTACQLIWSWYCLQVTREPVGKPPWNDQCSVYRNGVSWCDVSVQVLRYQVNITFVGPFET